MPDNSDSGFVDLRVGHGARTIGDDSVWPSFTDIMTVIVMIFLMALIIMMVRNFELDRQLVTTVSAQEASLLENQGLAAKLDVLEAKVTGLQASLGERVSERDALRVQLLEQFQRIELITADNAGLEEQIADLIDKRNQLTGEKQELTAQREVARARIADLTAAEEKLSREIASLSAQFSALTERSDREIGALTDANLSLSEQLDALSAQLSALSASSSREIETLTGANLSLTGQLETVTAQLGELELSSGSEIEALTGANLSLSEQLDVLTAQLEEVKALLQQSDQRDADSSARIVQLQELIRRRQAENTALQKLADATGAKFRSLQDEYDSLDAKYRSLVRPARSTAGKYVVDVRIVKSDDQYQFQLKEPAQDDTVNYDKAALDKRLGDLKAQHGGSLYTKVIIPEDNQLTHNEAWRFTQEILEGYDYYYQQYPDALRGDSAE